MLRRPHRRELGRLVVEPRSGGSLHPRLHYVRAGMAAERFHPNVPNLRERELRLLASQGEPRALTCSRRPRAPSALDRTQSVRDVRLGQFAVFADVRGDPPLFHHLHSSRRVDPHVP